MAALTDCTLYVFSYLIDKKNLKQNDALKIFIEIVENERGNGLEDKLFEETKLEFNQRLNNNKSSLEAKNISSSNDFSNNSYSFLKKKIKLLGLKNIILIKGDFKKTIPSFFKKNTKKKVFAANIDCDLYDSYTTVLTHTWPRLNKNGIILLDEYYSLKFPGARIAADDFFKINKIKPFKKKSWNTDFERWYIKK